MIALAYVDLAVVAQGGALCESLAAHVTHVLLVPGVDVLVRAQGVQAREGLAANLTHMLLLAVRRPFVEPERAAL
jgi:hypothetical protein